MRYGISSFLFVALSSMQRAGLLLAGNWHDVLVSMGLWQTLSRQAMCNPGEGRRQQAVLSPQVRDLGM